MKKKISNFMFSTCCCLGGGFIVAVLFFLLLLILHFEKNYLLICNYYNTPHDNLGNFLSFVFSDGYFLILFLPAAVCAVSWKVFHFLNCSSLKLLKCGSRTGIIWRYILTGFTIITGIMLYIILCIFLTGKVIGMRFVLRSTLIPNLLFAYISLLTIAVIYLLFAEMFSSNGMGVVGAMLPILFELVVWKSQIKRLFRYTLFYNIVEQEGVQISVADKIVFWSICLPGLVGLSLIVIRRVDLGTTRSVKEAVRYASERYNINPCLLGCLIWSFVYTSLTYGISKNLYSGSSDFVYICFRGFAELNIQNLVFYLGLCLPLWVFLIYYFSRFFSTFSIYVFMKMGGGLKCMLKCMRDMVRYTIVYFMIMMTSAYVGGELIYRGTGETDVYKSLRGVTDGMIGVIVDFILVTPVLILCIMILYLLCYKIEIAFVVGIGCHILCAVAAGFVSHGKEFIPLTQNILLIRTDKYNILWARSFTCLTLAAAYVIFCHLMKRKQEKILLGYYK